MAITFSGYRGIANDHPSELLARRHDSLRVRLILFALLSTVLVPGEAAKKDEIQHYSLPCLQEACILPGRLVHA